MVENIAWKEAGTAPRVRGEHSRALEQEAAPIALLGITPLKDRLHAPRVRVASTARNEAGTAPRVKLEPTPDTEQKAAPFALLASTQS